MRRIRPTLTCSPLRIPESYDRGYKPFPGNRSISALWYSTNQFSKRVTIIIPRESSGGACVRHEYLHFCMCRRRSVVRRSYPKLIVDLPCETWDRVFLLYVRIRHSSACGRYGVQTLHLAKLVHTSEDPTEIVQGYLFVKEACPVFL